MFWEYLPSSVNIASDWLRAKRALLWMRRGEMDDRVDTSFVSEGTDLFADLLEAQPCLWDPK